MRRRDLVLAAMLALGIVIAITIGGTPTTRSRYVAPTFFGQDLLNYPSFPSRCDGEGSCPTPPWGVNSIRLSVLGWCNLNPAPGKYNWQPLVDWLTDPAYRGADFMYTFVNPPLWAVGGGVAGCGSTSTSVNNLPPSESAWKSFVAALVHEADACCPGKLRHFEVWNEFDGAVFWAGTVDQMVRLTHAAAKIIHGARQGLKVLSPSVTQWDGNGAKNDGSGTLEQFLARDPASTGDIDIVDVHTYPATSNNGGSWPENSAYAQIENVRAHAMNPHGYGGYPLWSSEGGWGQNGSSFPAYADPTSQRAFVARYYLALLSLGLGRAYWYAYSNPAWGTLWSPSTGLTPGGVATRTVTDWLRGATLTRPCSHSASPPGLWTCDITRPAPSGYRGHILWVQSGGATISAPRGFAMLEKLSGQTFPLPTRMTIGIEPILMETRPRDVTIYGVRLAKRQRASQGQGQRPASRDAAVSPGTPFPTASPPPTGWAPLALGDASAGSAYA